MKAYRCVVEDLVSGKLDTSLTSSQETISAIDCILAFRRYMIGSEDADKTMMTAVQELAIKFQSPTTDPSVQTAFAELCRSERDNLGPSVPKDEQDRLEELIMLFEGGQYRDAES
jgi:hypothetical protein